ncbi:MAG: hypothetical protein HS117_21955 [Verrucomicrobiaceae bacterium]|nr:hypothetical protein [Verrucomicrobiaceae bacterium]
MRIIRFDEGFRLDDPNSRFGATDDAPAYQLEPGDPGYVNTAPTTGAATTRKGTQTMNETPENRKELLALTKNMRTGATQLQDVIDLHHFRADRINTAILKLEGDPAAAPGSNANKGSQLVYKMAEDATQDARAAMIAQSDGPVKTLLMAYREAMQGVHGRTRNAGWAAAGFTSSTAVPRDHDERASLLAAMRSYLAAHPEHEMSKPQPSGPPLQVTAAAALALGTTFQAALDFVGTCEGTQEQCKNLRDADHQGLYDVASGLTAELRNVLPDDDPRWENFGLNIPAHPNPPQSVTGLTLTSAGTGKERAEWNPAVRATYNRIFIKVHGVDEDFRFLARDRDSDHLISNLPPGATISVYIVAANAGGEAAPSPTVTKVVGV